MEVKVYNQSGNPVGGLSLPKSFEGKVSRDLMHQVLVSAASNMRTPVADTKNRGEVRGGGKKPWRQKGTGRARHGSIRSPIWKGGGVTHGPLAERNFKKKINKKMAKLALRMAVFEKARENKLAVFDEISLPARKTKEAFGIVECLSGKEGFEKFSKASKLVALRDGENVRAFRNIPRVTVMRADDVSAYDITASEFLLADKGAIESIISRIEKA